MFESKDYLVPKSTILIIGCCADPSSAPCSAPAGARPSCHAPRRPELCRRRHDLHAPAAVQFIAWPSDSLPHSHRGAQNRRTEHEMEDTAWNWSKLVRSFLRSELVPNIGRIFAPRNGSAPLVGSRSKHGTERLCPGPLVNQTHP